MSEILSPVGGEEQLVAAVRSGADAVYFGTKNLNARRNASNFDGEGLVDAVRYCHEHGVRVYVTLNTLVCDDELAMLSEEIEKVALAGADAVILQDLACAELIRRICPEMPLHASTQMAVHNASGLRALRDMGFSRAVVARELSFRELAKLRKDVPDIELEVFVHGALCMSVSGACYMSSIIGGRSGNRGLCAQPCRLDFRTKERDHALSLKDMCIIPHLKELESIGIDSFKIEGRMKRPEYVAASTDACVKALRGEEPDLGVLRDVFSRGGFTEGYFTGKRNSTMFGYRTKEDVEASSSVLGSLRSLYSRETGRVPCDMRLTVTRDSCILTASAGGYTVSVEGELPNVDPDRPVDPEKLEDILSKTGNTPFSPGKVECETEKDVSLPFSEVKSMRRQALEKLTAEMGRLPDRTVNKDIGIPSLSRRPEGNMSLRARFEGFSRMPSDLSAYEMVILPMEEILSLQSLPENFAPILAAEIPQFIFPEYEDSYLEKISRLREMGVTDAYCDNIGAVKACTDAGLRVHGGAGLNVTNALSFSAYADMGAADLTASFELSFKRISSLSGPVPLGILGYGYLPLMNFRSCPLRNEKGCPGKCPGHGTVTDRKGNVFRIECRDRMYSVLHNHVRLYTGDRRMPPVDFVTLWFTVESSDEAGRITDLFRNASSVPFERTAGLYMRELI